MDAKTLEWIIAAPLIIGLLIVSWWATVESHSRLDDPNDDRTVYLDRLKDILNLEPFGIFRVAIFRQSGNMHAESIVTGSAQDALAAALATLRRAKIDAVHVGANSETELIIGRLYHSHHGSNEGKKVGKVHITLIERLTPPDAVRDVERELQAQPLPPVQSEMSEPTVTFQTVGITCDCGARYDVLVEELENERICHSCGIDATLTQLQIAQIYEAADHARTEALERHRAGETDIQVEYKGKLTNLDGGLTPANVKRKAAEEAVAKLGLLKPDAVETIVSLIDDGMAEHPRATATRYRKDGEQLSKEEKKVAGIRANAFMSKQAWGELTDLGIKTPLEAHEITLLRTMFTVLRFQRVSQPVPESAADNFIGFKYYTIGKDCSFCAEMDGQHVAIEDVAILPSANCQCPTANYSVNMHFDWLKGIE